METKCEFCDERNGGSENSFRLNFTPDQIQSRVLAETQHFYVEVGLGALREGYLLVLPHQHIRAMGHLKQQDQFIELENMMQQIRKICEEYYQYPFLFFEHGSFSDHKPGGSCIDHAHLHVIPLQEDIGGILSESFSSYAIYDLSELQKPINEQKPYLFIEDRFNQRLVYNVPDTLPSQYLRRIWASLIHEDDKWDWGLYLERDNVINTFRKLEPFF